MSASDNIPPHINVEWLYQNNNLCITLDYHIKHHKQGKMRMLICQHGKTFHICNTYIGETTEFHQANNGE